MLGMATLFCVNIKNVEDVSECRKRYGLTITVFLALHQAIDCLFFWRVKNFMGGQVASKEGDGPDNEMVGVKAKTKKEGFWGFKKTANKESDYGKYELTLEQER